MEKKIWNWKIENWKVNHKEIHFSQQIHKKFYFDPKVYYIYFSILKLEKKERNSPKKYQGERNH